MIDKSLTDFEIVAQQSTSSSLIGEFWYYLRSTKRWWLSPILLALMVCAVLIFLASTSAAPFIYAIF